MRISLPLNPETRNLISRSLILKTVYIKFAKKKTGNIAG